MNDDCIDHLGISWETPSEGFHIPRVEEQREALFVFTKNMSGIVWNMLSTLENNPATLPQTETILQGHSVTGISIDELLQVKNYGDAYKHLITMIKTDTFLLSEDTACTLQSITGKEKTLEWGAFRKHRVHLNNVDFVPPDPEQLSEIAAKGFPYLRTIEEPQERAFVTFLWMSRNQFFYDCNKRTASLMLNGELISNHFYPFSMLKEEKEAFNKNMRTFYNTGNATEMLTFLSDTCRKLYMNPEQSPKRHRMR